MFAIPTTTPTCSMGWVRDDDRISEEENKKNCWRGMASTYHLLRRMGHIFIWVLTQNLSSRRRALLIHRKRGECTNQKSLALSVWHKNVSPLINSSAFSWKNSDDDRALGSLCPLDVILMFTWSTLQKLSLDSRFGLRSLVGDYQKNIFIRVRAHTAVKQK